MVKKSCLTVFFLFPEKSFLVVFILVKTVIMAGGKGTRLRPLTFTRPKPMIPLVNRPIMQYTVERLNRFGFRDIVMTLNYMSNRVKNYFKDGSSLGVNIDYSVEDSPLGTGGSVKKAKKYIDDTFIVLSGDVITDVNMTDVLNFHRDKGALATLVLTRVKDPTHFGIAEIDRDQKITSYLEKPSREEIFSNIANTGIYVFEPEIFDFFDSSEEEVDFSHEIFPRLIAEDSKMYGYLFNGYWNDVGRPETYLKATYDILNQKIKQKLYRSPVQTGIGKLGNISVGRGIQIGNRVRIEGPVVIGNNCTIEDGCKLSKGTVIGNNVFVGSNTSIEGAVILSESRIEKNSFLKGCIIDTKCHINRNTLIEEGVVTGSASEIGKNSVVRSSRHIKNEMKILPNSIIDSDY